MINLMKMAEDTKFIMKAFDERIRYLDESEGLPIADTWTDINSMTKPRVGSSKLILNYRPNPKPEALIKRIIKASSNEGMVIAVLFRRQWSYC